MATIRRNLEGDRDIEWGWVFTHLGHGPGQLLDFGPGKSFCGLVAAQRGYEVTALDLEPVPRHYRHPNLHLTQGDILTMALPADHFDVVINCSTVEHVGLAGRYGVAEPVEDGDLQAMARLRASMKPHGVMLLTLPVGKDAVFTPMCRVYGGRRLPQLLRGYRVEQEAFWVKDDANVWTLVDRFTATHTAASAGSPDPLQNVYGLGAFVLERD